MTPHLQLRTFRSPADPGWDEAMALCREAFPPRERRSEEDTVAALADPLFRADGILLDGALVGILFWWLWGEVRYIEHLAVDPALRGRNIGAQVLSEFCRGQRTILEIEPPEEPLAMRRKHFYERLGFRANPHPYVHPSYGCPDEPHPLVLMSSPELLSNDEARGFADFVREKVLSYSRLAAPSQPRL
ncbi:MAG: GNAT family N-acetyltransferase [Alistipes sp.]|nr:GNAT family N-acetyltransferase [Alistipes sp.]